MTETNYTTQLQAGLGMVEETKNLLDLWQEGMDKSELQQIALEAGRFPNMSARRLRNVVSECFAPRFLSQRPPAAWILKKLSGKLSNREFEQLLFLFTSRANAILADFVRQVYWPAYASGKSQLTNDEARAFIIQAIEDGKTKKAWSETTTTRVARYLTGTCADFGLLERIPRSTRNILPYQIEQRIVAILVYDLHFAGHGDNSIVAHHDWALFGLEPTDVVDELKRLALKDWLIVQAAGNVIRISWKHNSMEDVLNAIAQNEL